VDALDELRAALHRDPRMVAEQASGLADAARQAGDGATLSRALSVLGRARRSLGEIALAELDLRGAVEAGIAAGRPDLAADAKVGLAGVLSFAGRTAESLALLDEAEREGTDRERAYAGLQRAIVDQRAGRLDVALAAYDRALPTLRAIDARIDVAMVLANRGVLRIQTGDLGGAVADLTEARTVLDAEGNGFGVAQTEHGLGWAYTRLGDLPRALDHLDAAAAHFARLGHAGLEVDVDRVEVLLAAGLAGRAAELAAHTAERLVANGNHSLAAETWLASARAARLDGDGAAAAERAGIARTLFATQAAPGWERVAHLEVVRAGAAAPVAELVALADAFAATGDALGEATASALACQEAAASGDLTAAFRLGERSGTLARDTGVLETRLLAAQAGTSLALASGDGGRALRLARVALDDLAARVATLGATDARASAAAHGMELARTGLRIALHRGSAADVLEWMERARAGRSRFAPPRPPDDDETAAALTELRAVMRERRALEHAGADTTDVVRRQRELEEAVHRRSLRLPGGALPASRPADLDAVRAALGGRLLVALAEVEGRLVAVRVDATGAALRLVGGAAEVERATAAAAASLRSLALAGGSGPLDLLGRATGLLDRAVAPLVVGEAPVVLVLPPPLHAAPWSLLPSLRGRHVVVAPSATWLVAAGQRQPARPGAPLVVAGPRLAYAEHEARRVAASWPGAVALTGSEATVADVTEGLTTAPVAHIAAHGHLRHDNPLWSSLELGDGPLSVYDLERLPGTPPTVVLSACDSGLTVRAGEELLGLASSLLSLGTLSLVAAVCPLPDTPATAEVMAVLHGRLVAGAPPAAAVDELAGGFGDDGSAAVARCLACFGLR